MIEITRIGENTIHDNSFFVDRPNGHPVYLLILIKTPTRFWVDGKIITVTPPVAVLFKPGQKHWYGPLDTPDCPDYIDDWMHISSSTPLLSEHFPFGTPIPLHNPEDYYTLFHLIHNEYYGATTHKYRIIDYLTNALLDKIAAASNTKEYPAMYYELAAIREKIYLLPHHNWNISGIAKSLGISEGYFHSIYKRFFDTTCITDVTKSRIQKACELLSSTHKSVETISEEVGYQYTEHFIRQFKAETGTTPGRYRKGVR